MPTSPINLIWQSQPLTVTAKVDAVINPTDTLLWEHEFVATLNPDPYSGTYDLNWDGGNAGCTQGTQDLSAGKWRFSALSGVTAATRIQLVDGDTSELLGMLSANGDTFEITVPLDNDRPVQLLQNGDLSIALVAMQRVESWDTSGYLPTIATAGNQLAAHWDYSPRPGVLTARAKVYDGNDALIATSSAITLSIAGASSGGC